MARRAEREDGSWDPEAGTVYVWYDALINYITGAGFPDDPVAFERWWPADLHVIGKDIARFHTIYWPAMLWSAGLEPPRRVWIHGWLLVQGERMSKSRGNFFDPNAMVDALGVDGTRYVLLREAAFDRDSDVSWDSFLRRYNADLANDWGNLVNRTVTMARRYLGGERPAPQAADVAHLAEGWSETLDRYRAAIEGCRLHDALGQFAELVGRANRTVDAEQPWVLAKAATAGDAAAERASVRRPRRPHRDLSADGLGRGAVHANHRASGARAARLRLPVCRGWQRRPAAARRADLGCPRA